MALDNNRVKVLRKSLGLTQVQLAKIVGATQQTIGAIEKGEYEYSSYLVDIAKALNTTTDYLSGHTDIADVMFNDYSNVQLIEEMSRRLSSVDNKLCMSLYNAYLQAPENIQEAVDSLLQIEK